jgi:uncharacterized pyridoxamine 5'-phosphate oxidase family protein
MNREEILEFMNNNPIIHLATVEKKRPRVRSLLAYRADESGLIFHTGKTKDLYKQLSENPEVEICYNNLEEGVQIRVSGIAELKEDLELKKEIVEAREFLKPWVEKDGYDFLAVYQVKDLTATVWTMETNLEPKRYIQL